jgi:hypothetical protein
VTHRIPRDAFVYYLSLGPNRSYEAVAEHFKVSRRGIARLAKRQQWQDRIADIERKAQQSMDQHAQEALEAVNDRHLRTAQVLLRKGLEYLRERALTQALAVRAIEIGIKLERDIRGIASDRAAPTTFKLPELKSAADIAKAFSALLEAIAAGQVSVDEGSRVGGLLELHRKALETADIEARLRQLEEASAETVR